MASVCVGGKFGLYLVEQFQVPRTPSHVPFSCPTVADRDKNSTSHTQFQVPSTPTILSYLSNSVAKKEQMANAAT